MRQRQRRQGPGPGSWSLSKVAAAARAWGGLAGAHTFRWDHVKPALDSALLLVHTHLAPATQAPLFARVR
jgi:hypothetical protein